MTVPKKFGIVVMLDALGVSNFSLDESRQFIEDFDEIISEIKIMHDGFVESSRDVHNKNVEIFQAITHTLKNVIITQFGDTLILAWPLEKNEDKHNLSALLSVVVILNALIYRSLTRKIPFRGCISVGDYISSNDNKTILGPAIFDANSWYDSADWFGIIFSPKAQLWLSKHLEMNFSDGKDLSNTPLWKLNICEYDVPLTEHAQLKNASEKFSVLGWPSAYYFYSDLKNSAIQELFQHLSNMPMPKGTESKYKNSIDFFKFYESEVYQKNPIPYFGRDHPVKSLLSKSERSPKVET